MSADFDRVLLPGYIIPSWYKVRRRVPVFVRVRYHDGRLSLAGVEGPNDSGNCVGGCGQIDIRQIAEPAAGWTRAEVRKLADTWKRWHLNDMRAGTPEQEEYLRDYRARNPDAAKDYGSTCLLLKAAGLYEVPDPRDPSKTYAYGSAWLREEVPPEVIEYLRALPASPVRPAWS